MRTLKLRELQKHNNIILIWYNFSKPFYLDVNGK